MEQTMEKLMEKQMKWQKITAILLAILIAALLFAGFYIGQALNEVTEAVEQAQIFLTEATEKLDALDVEGINQTFSGIDEFVAEAGGMVETMNDVTEKLDAASQAFDPIIESLNNLKNRLSFF